MQNWKFIVIGLTAGSMDQEATRFGLATYGRKIFGEVCIICSFFYTFVGIMSAQELDLIQHASKDLKSGK